MILFSQFAGGGVGLRRRHAQIESGYGIQRPVGMGSTGGIRSTENIRVVTSCGAYKTSAGRTIRGRVEGDVTTNTACPGRSSARPACKTFASVSVPTKSAAPVPPSRVEQKKGMRNEVREGTRSGGCLFSPHSRGGRNSITLVPKLGASRRKGQSASPSTQAYDAANAVARNLCRPAAILRMK